MRYFAQDLRGRSDAELAALLLDRPDLARPAPADVTTLASRATTTASLTRALDDLPRADLDLLTAAVLVGGTAIDSAVLAPLLPAWTRDDLDSGLARLWLRSLLWRPADGYEVVRGIEPLLGPHPGELGPPAAALGVAVLAPSDLESAIAAAPAPGGAIVARLAAGPPVAHRPDPGGASAAAVEALVAAGVLATDGSAGSATVVLPREHGLALRGHLTDRAPAPADVTAADADGPLPLVPDVDAAGGLAAADLVAVVEELLRAWDAEPPRVLRSGDLGVRDLRRAAGALELDDRRAATVLGLLLDAGLVADDHDPDPAFRLTPLADAFLAAGLARRWALLVRTWWRSDHVGHLVGTPGRAGTIGLLSDQARRPAARSLRRSVVAALVAARPVAPPLDRLLQHLADLAPRRVPAGARELVDAVLLEGELLGVLARGAAGTVAAALADGADEEDLETACAAVAPQPVDQLILQGDLTAIAPGPLVPELARLMHAAADVESRGGATVFRFSRASITRALDAGTSADHVLAVLAEHSPTPLPQPLDYLVRDTARRHGAIRVGGVGSYVRSDDETALEALVRSADAAPAQLRRIAPTVLVSPLAPRVLSDLLSDLGIANVSESSGGELLLPGRARRAAVPRAAEVTVRRVDDALVAEVVAAMRTGQERTEAAARDERGRPALRPTDPTTAIAVLRDAAADRRAVWVGYADSAGAVSRILFHPERIEGGRILGRADGSPRTLSVHRITAAAWE